MKTHTRIAVFISIFAVLIVSENLSAQNKTDSGNKPERAELFSDLGVGMFIHWSMESQIGVEIGHSLAGASEDYINRYIDELPKLFYPKKFDPDSWAKLAKLSGMKYVVFTTKHLGGFCMFDTKTTEFNIMNTPYGKDITREITDSFRKYGISAGLYFSPDDLWFLHKNGKPVIKGPTELLPVNYPELMQYDLKQIRELLTNYGPIDVFFIDSLEPDKTINKAVWSLQPDIFITRGAIVTPEQRLPDKPVPGPWEACETLGTQWGFKPTNEQYKSGTRIIEILVETRAKGGNLLLNVGPTWDGEIAFEQERILKELGLWLFVNGEAIYNVRPWHVTREGNIWFTKKKDSDTLYAIVTGEPWVWGEWNTITLKSVRATEKTETEILGQSGLYLEYKNDVKPKSSWKQDADSLHITAMRAQRLYDNLKWPNPVVIKITNVRAAE